MQQESQGKRPSARKRVAASGSTEVKQEEKSGSAAKKPKLDPTGEPGTSGVSNTRKTRKFKVVVKKGSPKRDELEQLANDIDPSDWKKVARKLKIHDPKIKAIHKENEEFYEKIYQMLLKWK
ncbi:unnamed protein product [Pocillopora meandrina]|uniref:Death domain-containing protein n=1 Tax=Pocillopora meandrina TaxID=46732 RepID=A0AAU9X7N5_9CNID|nr:unnamed protein product [Pocillopora meandrina]